MQYQKLITTILELRQWHSCSIFINKFEQIKYHVFFVEFERVNVCLRKLDV